MSTDGDRVPVEPNLETVSGPNGELGDVLHDISVLCATCQYYRGNSRCGAFGGEIPWAIVAGLHDHRKPYPGDNGTLYAPTPGAAARLNPYLASPNVRSPSRRDPHMPFDDLIQHRDTYRCAECGDRHAFGACRIPRECPGPSGSIRDAVDGLLKAAEAARDAMTPSVGKDGPS